MANFGHFTSMRVEADGTVRGFGLHLERLVRDCQATFGVPLDPEIARGFVRQFVRRNPGPLALRVTVYDPTLTVGAVGQSASPHFLVTANPATDMPSSPLRLKTFPFTRDAAEIKHTGLWSQLHRRRQAKLAGFDDALFVEPDRSVSEGATWTVGFIDADNRVVWPDAPTLPSTTQQLLDQACDTPDHRGEARRPPAPTCSVRRQRLDRRPSDQPDRRRLVSSRSSGPQGAPRGLRRHSRGGDLNAPGHPVDRPRDQGTP